MWERAPLSPYGAGPARFDPYQFAYATARSSIVGKKLGLRGQIAGLGLGAASLAFFKPPMPNDLVLHQNFSLLKDFVGTSLRGTIGAAVAYLEMLDMGYVWQGHWEDCVAPGYSGAHPDFVFAKPTSVCLVDAKGTTAPAHMADAMAKHEWRRQIYDNRDVALKSGGTANEGRVVATLLSEASPVELVSACGSWRKVPTRGLQAGPAPGAVASVQRANFIDAFFLVGFANLAWKMLGFRNTGPLEQTSASMVTLNGEALFVGPSRMVLSIGHESLAMHLFCRRSIVDAAMRSAARNFTLPMEVPLFESGLKSGVGNVSRPMTLVDGPDGVGAVFRPIGAFTG